MNEIPEQNNKLQAISIIVFLHRHIKPLLIVASIAIVLSVVFSSEFFIKPKYKSSVIIFPTSTNSISKALLSENPGAKQDIMELGDEERADQLLQILSSDGIKNRIIKKYNLIKHYGINPDSKYVRTKLSKKFDDNIKFHRTEFMSIEVDVMDTDPQMAADIANDIAALMDTINSKMQQERAKQALKIVENEYNNFRNTIKTMEDSLTKIMQLGVFDYETQSSVLNEQLAIALSKNNKAGVKALEEKLKTLADYGSAYISLRDNLLNFKKQYTFIKSKYDETKVDAERVLPCKFIVNNAYKAEKKSYPVRWLIVLISTISAEALAVLLLLFKDKFKSINFSLNS
ncbi:MAG: Wzz/FepE/Etk N-terminal domain-containing protein [Bacteroidota bacterium]|nr:Wzz/FepE/Etk N-terminal domain-containing protein [Bacteroidota bacterium]